MFLFSLFSLSCFSINSQGIRARFYHALSPLEDWGEKNMGKYLLSVFQLDVALGFCQDDFVSDGDHSQPT